MVNRITRIPPWPVGKMLFLTATCIFGLGGVLLGLLEKNAIGLWGGAFLGLLGGLTAAGGGVLFCLVYNLLAPVTGGILVETEQVEDPAPTEEAEDTAESDSPSL